MSKEIKKFLLDLLFPRFCFNCRQEGSYLCEDCQSVLGVLNTHQKYTTHPSAGGLKDLYFALPYQGSLIKNLIQKFKYRPFVKELAISLTSLIITHFRLLDNKPDFFYPVRDQRSSNGADFILIPIPLEKKRLKWRGFNPAEELAKELSIFFRIPLVNNALVKIKTTLPQVELSEEERKENIKGAFLCQNSNQIKEKRILLIDDIYTTGATLKEGAKVLKKAGAKEIIGIVIARG